MIMINILTAFVKTHLIQMKSQKPRSNFNISINRRTAVVQQHQPKQQKKDQENGHKLKNYLITLRGHWSFPTNSKR